MGILNTLVMRIVTKPEHQKTLENRVRSETKVDLKEQLSKDKSISTKYNRKEE